MATSGTYAFNPATADIILDAFGRIQVRRTALQVEHLVDAANQANFLLVEWANKQPLLWTSEEVEVPLVQGTATYTLDPQIVMILLCAIRTGSGTSQIDRVIGPLSTVEYSAISSKNTQGPPSTYWFNRQITPRVTFWQVPDGNGPYTAMLRTVRQVQDATIPGGYTTEVPYRFLDAFSAGLAHRLARFYAPALEMQRKQDALDAWTLAAEQDVESVSFFVYPGLSSYMR